MMKLPTLSFLTKEEVKIEVSDGTDENGALDIKKSFEVKARFEQSNSVIYTKEGTKVSLRGKLFIFEKLDEFPDDMSGFCTIDETKYDIVHASKKRNPDNSVNHVVLELI